VNKHIEDNLNHYTTIKNPEYAILLSGKWGSGKTYFINKFIEKIPEEDIKKNKIKFIRISLFGVNDTSSIDEDIFQQLHPILGHKYTKFAGNIFKNTLKYGLKLDIDGDNKSDSMVKVDISSFNPLNILDDSGKSDKELIFIFDDLERTSMELPTILGYINYLIELSGFKVIILANEEKIKDKGEYKDFKEKVIGKSFEIKQDIDATFDSFINTAKSGKDILDKNNELIKKIFKIGKYNNLRHIKQTILDFDYFYEQLDEIFKTNDAIMENIIYEFFFFSIEIKAGILDRESFKSPYSERFEDVNF